MQHIKVFLWTIEKIAIPVTGAAATSIFPGDVCLEISSSNSGGTTFTRRVGSVEEVKGVSGPDGAGTAVVIFSSVLQSWPVHPSSQKH